MRQMSLAVAALLALSFFIFMTGYFLGKRKAIQEFSYHVDQESLADQIYSSMCVLYDAKDDNEDEEEVSEENENAEISKDVEQKAEVITQNTQTAVSSLMHYKAPFAGFSAAQQ